MNDASQEVSNESATSETKRPSPVVPVVPACKTRHGWKSFLFSGEGTGAQWFGAIASLMIGGLALYIANESNKTALKAIRIQTESVMRPYVELRIGEVALTHQSDETITIPWVARNTGSSAASRVFVVTAQSNKNRAIIPFKSTALGTFNMLYPDEEQGGRADLNLAFPVDTTYLHTIVMYTYGIPMIYQKTEEDQLLTYVRLTTFQVLRKWDNSIDFKTQGSVERGFRGNLKIHEFVFDHPGYDMALSLPNITFEQRGDSLFIIAD